MKNILFDKKEFIKCVKDNVKTLYRKTIEEASEQEVFQAVSYAVKDVIIDNWLATQQTFDKEDPKMVYYMSMEFLMGRALGNNLINLTAYKEVKEALDEIGFDLNMIEDQEPDRHSETVVWAVWLHVLWIPLLRLVTLLTDVVSVIVTVCSNRRSKTVIRWKYRITG